MEWAFSINHREFKNARSNNKDTQISEFRNPWYWCQRKKRKKKTKHTEKNIKPVDLHRAALLLVSSVRGSQEVLEVIVWNCIILIPELLLVNIFTLSVLFNYGINYRKRWYQPVALELLYIQFMARFLPRCMECRLGLAMRILSVCLSVRQTRELWQNRRKISPNFCTTRKNI